MATGRLAIHPMMHLLRNEMADFPLGEHDDAVDSLAMQLQVFRGQMAPEWWEKYSREEAKLLRKIQRGDTGIIPIRNKNFDYDEDAENDKSQPIYDFHVA